MSSKKKVSKAKAPSKSTGKKPVKKEIKAVSKKADKKKTVAKPKANTSKKPIAKKIATKKTATKSVKSTTKKVAPKKIEKAKTAKKVIPTKKAVISPKTKKIEKIKATKAPKVAVKKVVEPKVVAKAIKPAKAPKEPKPIPPEKLKKQEEALAKKQLIEQKSKEVLAINNNIPIASKNEISQTKIASISHSITNPVKRSDSYSIKPDKEPAGKFELEFVVHASAEMIYEFISTPSGLSEWFCDDLNIRNGIYTFIWDDTMQQARLLKTIDLQLVRFQWVDKMDGSYFELRIQRDDLTNDISLMITDFAESVADRESSKLLWHNQIEKLMHVLGSVF